MIEIPSQVAGIFFLLFSFGLVLTAKRMFRRTLAFRMFSAETVTTVGFVVYLILPGAMSSEELALPLWRYALHVWAAYFAMLLGMSLAKRCMKRQKQAAPPVTGRSNHRSDAVALILLALIVAWHLTVLYQAGGFSFIVNQWTTNRIMATALDSADSEVGAGDAIGAILLNGTFVVLWSMVFTRWPVRATILWYAETLCKLSGFTGRSSALAMLLAPYLAYVIIHKVPRRRLLVQTALLAAVCAVFFSWASSFRLRANYNFSLQQVLLDLSDSTATPIIYGSRFLDDPSYRGSAATYALAYLVYPIPRAFWRGKPGETMNKVATMQITGRRISSENSYMVFTILGEGWFYFGAAGAVAIFLPFGALAKWVDLHFSGNYRQTGVHVMILLYAFFQMRSSALTYFQMCTCYAAIAMVVSATLGRRAKRVSARPDGWSPDRTPGSGMLVRAPGRI